MLHAVPADLQDAGSTRRVWMLPEEDEKITQIFHQRSESGAMKKVPGSQPLLALMQKHLNAADHKLALKRTIKHLN